MIGFRINLTKIIIVVDSIGQIIAKVTQSVGLKANRVPLVTLMVAIKRLQWNQFLLSYDTDTFATF